VCGVQASKIKEVIFENNIVTASSSFANPGMINSSTFRINDNHIFSGGINLNNLVNTTLEGRNNTAEGNYYPLNIDLTNAPPNILDNLSGNINETNGTYREVNISGTMTNNQTIPKNSRYILHSITIPVEKTLTVYDGVVLRLTGNTAITTNGNLIVEGTEENRVVITSTSDPDYGRKWHNTILEESGYRKHGKF
jgi:hypothetical protein